MPLSSCGNLNSLIEEQNNMEKLQHNQAIRRLIMFANLIIFVLLLFLLHDSSLNAFDSWKNQLGKDNSMELNMRRLVRGRDRNQLQSTGISCHSDTFSDVCVSTKQVTIDTQSLSVYLSQSQAPKTAKHKQFIKPYAGKNNHMAMKWISPLKIYYQVTNSSLLLPNCEFHHMVPAIVFSSGGFSGNLFHGLSDVIIPLFLTSRHFRSQVKFVITDYNPRWVKKFDRILKQLSSFQLIVATKNSTSSVHCFPGVVMGLKYHAKLGVNYTGIPGGYRIDDFRKFLRETYDLKRNKILLKPKRPILLLILRRNTRMFLNEDEMVRMMEEQGFEVHTALPNEMKDLDKFSQVVNSCDVMVGAHGAGMANEVFLPGGAVVVEVVPIGLNWLSTSYYARPAIDMGLKYLQYHVELQESSLSESYGPNDPVITSPESIFAKKGYTFARAIYLSGQNVKINVGRFKRTLSHAAQLLGY